MRGDFFFLSGEAWVNLVKMELGLGCFSSWYHYGLNYFPPRYMCWSPTPALQNVTVFGDTTFTEMMRVKWGHKECTLIQSDWCPYKKRKRHQECICTEAQPCEDARRRWPLKVSPASHPGLSGEFLMEVQGTESVSACESSCICCSQGLWADTLESILGPGVVT